MACQPYATGGVMAVPKTKKSKSRTRTRKNANFKAHPATIVECPHCHAVMQPHKICGNCGFYKGAQVIETKTEKKEKKDKAKAAAAK